MGCCGGKIKVIVKEKHTKSEMLKSLNLSGSEEWHPDCGNGKVRAPSCPMR